MVGQTPKPMIQPTSHPPSLPTSPTVIPKSEPIVQLTAESFAPVPSLEAPIVRLSNPPTSAPTSLNVTTVVEKYLPRKPPRTSSSAKKQLRIYHSFRWCSAVRQFILDMCLWVLDIVAGKSHTAQMRSIRVEIGNTCNLRGHSLSSLVLHTKRIEKTSLYVIDPITLKSNGIYRCLVNLWCFESVIDLRRKAGAVRPKQARAPMVAGATMRLEVAAAAQRGWLLERPRAFWRCLPWRWLLVKNWEMWHRNQHQAHRRELK